MAGASLLASYSDLRLQRTNIHQTNFILLVVRENSSCLNVLNFFVDVLLESWNKVFDQSQSLVSDSASCIPSLIFRPPLKSFAAAAAAVDEWLPVLLGPDSPSASDYSYNPEVDPSIQAFFSTAAFRFGHSMLPSFLWTMGAGNPEPKFVPLRETFFAPEFVDEDGIDEILRGAAHHVCKQIDQKVHSTLHLLFRSHREQLAFLRSHLNSHYSSAISYNFQAWGSSLQEKCALHTCCMLLHFVCC